MDPRVTTFIVMAVLVACFSVLLPNVVWPMFRSVFISEKPQPQHDPRGPGPSRPGGGFAPGMRPNPGSQGHSPRPQQGSPSPGGGKAGYLGFILPLYAVGISLYLIFTLFKIFVGGGNGGEPQSAITRNLDHASQAELSHSIQEVDRILRMTDGADVSQRTRPDFECEAAAADAEASVMRKQEEERRRRRDEEEQRLRVTEMLYDLKQDADSQGEELRRHLNKAKGDSEDSALQEKELKQLESRLQRTEKAMAQILKAMGHIPENLGLGEGDDGGDDEEEEVEETEADIKPHSQQQQHHSQEKHLQQQLPQQPNSDRKFMDVQNVFPSISLKLPGATLISNTDSSDASNKAFTYEASNASSSANASGSAAINTSDSVASISDAASVPKVVSIRAFERNLDHKETPAKTIEVSEKCQTETTRVDNDDDSDAVEDEGRKNLPSEAKSTKVPEAPIPFTNNEEKKSNSNLNLSSLPSEGVSEVIKSPNADSLSEIVERRTQSVQRRKPASRSTSLLSQASNDRDSLDDATTSAWESIWPDYSTTNVETVGLGIDAEKLRARVLRGVHEEDDGQEPEDETPASIDQSPSADQQPSMGVDFDQLRARVLQGNAALSKTSVQVSNIGIKDVTGDSLHPDDDEDVDDDEDLYEHDSVEMEDEERKEVDMVDSLLEDDFGFVEDTNSKTELFLPKENSPVLRTSFTPEEVQNLRQRVGRLEK